MMKTHRQNNETKRTPTYVIHMWWSIVIISLLLIGAISFIFSERIINAESLSEYISFASVLLSIILSIFAILYTYTSNVQIQEQFNKIDSAATNIRDVSYQLHNVGNRLSESLLDIQNKLTNIDIAQQELNKKISDRNVKLDVKDLIKDLSNKS